MGRAVRSVLMGPYPWWSDLWPAPIGMMWVNLTAIGVNEFSTGAGRVCFPALYLRKAPYVGTKHYWEHVLELEKMKDDSTNRQAPGKWKMPEGEPFLKGLPALAQYCTDFWWEDTKKPRTPCKIAITFFDGACNISLNDEEKRRSCHTTAQTVQEALQLLDSHLAAGSAPWRHWGKPR